jgi:GT2 family glycosyltransferase
VVPWTLFYGGHFSTSTKALFEVGLFDENYDGNWGTEDQDLGYRLHLANKQIMLCRDAVVLHLPHESDSAAKEREGYANCKYFNHKFQTLETQLFLDCYAKDVAVQFTHSEVFDFHEYFINHVRKTNGKQQNKSKLQFLNTSNIS